MHTRWLTPQVLVPALILSVVAGLFVWTNRSEGRSNDRSSPPPSGRPMPSMDTSSEGLAATVVEMDRRLAQQPGDVAAAVRLADALMRLARVSSDGGLVGRAEAAIRGALDQHPADYQAQQMLAMLYLSEHKFRQAADAAQRIRTTRPLDPINHGILGDALLELGEYDDAFDAFDRMMQLRPNAASYARVAYARELQGNLAGALESMQLALDAVPAGDDESLAWHHAQLGELQLKLGDTARAAQEFIAASHAFPGHPFAVLGYARTLAAQGDRQQAIVALRSAASSAVNPDVHSLLGELLEADGQRAEAATQYGLAEVGWRSDAPEPRSLAKFLAARGRVDEALPIAEAAAAARDDIFTDDALAWVYFKAGRQAAAERAIARALRTGTRDRDILSHAAEIRGASGNPTR